MDPYRKATIYTLVHKKDTKNCPKSVLRCEVCRQRFSGSEILLIKTKGHREFFNKTSQKMMKTYGNIYIHFLMDCLTQYDNNFSFPQVLALKSTLDHLPPNAIISLQGQGIAME